MKKIVVATHYKLADGFQDTLINLTGVDIYSISAYVNTEDIEQEIEDVFEQIYNMPESNDDIFIFTDLIGGSVSQHFFKYCSDTVHLIAGINLPLIMEVCLDAKEHYTEQDIQQVIEVARNSISYINNILTEDGDDDE